MDARYSTRRPAVFLDRDGVLNVEKSYICSEEELEIYDFAKRSVELIHEKGYYAIVVSNQSGVARGMLTEETLRKINALLIEKTGVDEVYYCPHYKEGKIKKYAIECNCRKPKIGLIEMAQEKFNIDMEGSYMVGDRTSDIQMGQNAGVRTVLVKTGYGEHEGEFDNMSDRIYNNLMEFAQNLQSAKRRGENQ